MVVALADRLKVAFTVLGCAITAVFIYTGLSHGFRTAVEIFSTPWARAITMNFYVNVIPFSMWIFHKESNWLHSVIWIFFVAVAGSPILFSFIVLQLLKLSPQESLQDPIYFVLRSNTKRDQKGSKGVLSVVRARVLFGGLGCFIVGMLSYVTITNGSPFRWKVITPWVLATFLDAQNILIAVSVWVVYKELTWITAALWIIVLLCFQSIGTCAYIVVQLFQLSPEDPISLVLFRSYSRPGNGYEQIN